MTLLDEQLSYYRARASRYDQDVRGMQPFIRAVGSRLARAPKVNSALELACGTGRWTRMLLQRARRVAVVDGAPEMLRIARARAGTARVTYEQADLFTWTPADTHDLVFFANWLSHVPPRKLRPFLRTVTRAVAPGGRLVIVDQDSRRTAGGAHGRVPVRETRSLGDAGEFAIVKVYYDTARLRDVLAALGFTMRITRFGPFYFMLTATRPARPGSRAPGSSTEGKTGSARRRKK